MSNNRQFKHGNDESSDYINQITQSKGTGGGGRRYEQMDISMNSQEWTDTYRPYQNANDKDTKASFGCMSLCVLIFSILIMLGGIALIVIGALQKKDNIIPLCPNCEQVEIGLYATGGIIVFIGLLGFLAALCRVKALAVPFMIFIFLFGLVFLGGGVFCIIMRENPDTVNLLGLWKSTVQSSPQFACNLQQELGCSGFQSGCCSTNQTSVDGWTPSMLNMSSFCYINGNNGTAYDVLNRSIQLAWPAAVCPVGCPTNFTTMCDVAIRNEIQTHLIPILVVLIGLGVLSIVMGILSLCMTSSKKRSSNPYDDDGNCCDAIADCLSVCN